MKIVSAVLLQAQYTCTKPTQPGLWCRPCQLQIDHNHSCSLPLCLSEGFEEVGAIHCMPSVNFPWTALQCCWFSLFHLSFESKIQIPSYSRNSKHILVLSFKIVEGKVVICKTCYQKPNPPPPPPPAFVSFFFFFNLPPFPLFFSSLYKVRHILLMFLCQILCFG